MKLLNWLLDLLYPRRCAFCHKLTEDGSLLCPACRKTLPYTKGTMQKQKLPFIDGCLSPLYYEGDVRQSLLRYKFHSATAYAEVYGEFLAKCIDENGISCDSITWVPLSRGRLRSRGYDQARLLAEELARRQGFPCEALLRKLRNNPAQSGTGSLEKRRANVQGVYQVIRPQAVQGKRILLLDDIVTTGSTLSECARMLRMAGAKQVMAATVARGRD